MAWGKLKTHKLRFNDVDSIPNTEDRRIIAMLVGSLRDSIYGYSSYYQESISPQFSLPPPLWEVVLPLICATGRSLLRVSNATDELLPLSWDDGDPWEFYLRMAPAEIGAAYRVCGGLGRGEIEMPIAKPLLMLAGGLVFSNGQVARLNDHRAFAWIALLRQKGELSIPKQDSEAFLGEVLRFAHYPRLELPEELRFQETVLRPKPKLLIKPGPRHPFRHPRLLGKLGFDYDGQNVFHNTPGNVYDQERRRLIRRDLAFESAARRRMVFQQFGLLPWRTVMSNVEFGLEIDGVPRDERRALAEKYLELVGLKGFENYYPHQISGGMQQRVGIARALSKKPEILLMDEPFGAVDAQTREQLQEELLKIWAQTENTVVFVTHSIDEAIYLSDRVVVMQARPGRIKEEVAIDLPRPRWEGDIKADPRFAQLRAHLRDSLRS